MEKYFSKHSVKRNSELDLSSDDRAMNVDVAIDKRPRVNDNAALDDEHQSYLATVIHAARYLLGQGLAFGGSDESEDPMHKGHFLEVVNLFCGLWKDINKVTFCNARKNDQLNLSVIQRDIIECCAMETRKVILGEMKDKYFSILIDEARDCSIKEHMAIVFRFVNDDGVITERFFELVHIPDASTHFLKNAIDDFFAKHGISLARLRGQGYDGGSYIRSGLNGLKTLINKENKHARYMNCLAHQLHLIVMSIAMEEFFVGQFFETFSTIVNAKRTRSVKSREVGFARLGDIHLSTLFQLFDMWTSLEADVLSLCEGDDKIRNAVGRLIDKMYTFEFVFVGKFILHILGLVNTLSNVLQQKGHDIDDAIRMIGVTKKELQDFRDSGWDNLLNDVSKFCEHQNIEVPNMETIVPGRIRQLIIGGPKTYFQHFHGDIFLKVTGLVVEEFNNLFTQENIDLLRGIMCLDPSDSFSKIDKEKLLHVATLYSDDFSGAELVQLDHQLEIFIRDVTSNEKFSNLEDVEALAKKMVELGYNKLFHLVYRLLELILVLPVETTYAGRCFSTVDVEQTELSCQTEDGLLSDRMLCFTEKAIFETIKTETILQCFQNLASRRNILPPISGSTSDCSSTFPSQSVAQK